MVTKRTIIPGLLGACFLLSLPAPVRALITVDVAVPGGSDVEFEIPPAPPNPDLPELTFHNFDLNNFFKGAFPGQTPPDALPKGTFAENQTSFHLALVSLEPVNASQKFEFNITGGFWSVDSMLEYAAAGSPIFDSDVVTLSGEAQHLAAPHAGERSPGDPVSYKVELHAGRSLTLSNAGVQVTNSTLKRILKEVKIPSGGRFGVDTHEKPHPDGDHKDFLLSQLSGKVANPSVPFISSEIQFWAGGVSGLHTPEPATWASLCAGIGVLGWFRRRSQRLSSC